MTQAVILPTPGPFAEMDVTESPVTARTSVSGDVFGAHRGPLTVTDDFGVLDDPVEQESFTEYAGEAGHRLAESVLMVQGMYCAACADTVECALQGLPGVQSAQVHAATRRLTLRWDPAVTRMSTLAGAVGTTGYRLLPMHQALSISERLKETRLALWRLFVAGICAMQVMMYALPAYVTEPGEIPADIVQLLRFASWLLSLPVVFFASGPFFRSAWHDLKRWRVGMDTPVSIGILVSFLVSSAATFDPAGPWGAEVWFDSLTMFVFFLLGGRYLELKARDRTAGALDALMNRLPEVADRQRPDGSFESVSVRRLRVGDVVRVHAGQAFPGDGELVSGSATVDEALLTGESDPLLRHVGDYVVAGSYNLAGPAMVRISGLGKDTRFAQIVSLMEKASTEKPRLARLADRIAAPFLGVVLVSALAAGIYWWQVDHTKALAVAVSVLIVTCPCALSLATPAAMLTAAGALARRGLLVRRLQAFETLSHVDTVVLDKTGTVTQDRLEVVKLHISGPSSSIHGREAWVQAMAASLAQHSLHPVSRAIAASGEACRDRWPVLTEIREVAGKGMEGRLPDGAVLRIGSAAFCGADAALPEGLPTGPKAFIAVDGGGWVAVACLQEQLRDDARLAINTLRADGISTMMLSGDRQGAADSVAQELNIDRVVAGATPEMKLEHLQALQRRGHKVAMVGDGLNDGPVLARADTSFALGHAAALAQAQSDFIVQGGRLMDIVMARDLAVKTMQVVRQNLAWAAVYNAVSVPLALMGWMPPWAAGLGMAGSSLLVVINATRLSLPSHTEASAS